MGHKGRLEQESKGNFLGHVGALVKSDKNGLQPFESTIEQTTETMPPNPKIITAATMIKQ